MTLASKDNTPPKLALRVLSTILAAETELPGIDILDIDEEDYLTLVGVDFEDEDEREALDLPSFDEVYQDAFSFEVYGVVVLGCIRSWGAWYHEPEAVVLVKRQVYEHYPELTEDERRSSKRLVDLLRREFGEGSDVREVVEIS